MSGARIIALWSAVAVVSALAAAAGYAVLGDASGEWVAFIQAFAAGAILTMLADTMIPEAFDAEHPLPPPPQALEIGDTRYASQLLAVVAEDGRAAIHRRRQITGRDAERVVVRLDRVSADEVTAEARAVGFIVEPSRRVPETERYLGSTIVVLRAP